MKVVVATYNQHKVSELHRIFQALDFDINLIAFNQTEDAFPIAETGSSFEENALIKARIVHEATGLPTIADDSGLEVEVLQGMPGIFSSRYASPDANDTENRRKLIYQLNSIGTASSPAAFRCALCYSDSVRTIITEGSAHGSIANYERGHGGFGYDALFTPSGNQQSFAEMSPEEKDSYSHRSQAVRRMSKYLSALNTDSTEVFEPDPIPLRDGLVMASIAAAMGSSEHLRMAVRLLTRSAADINLLYEALLQTYLFAGYPAALESLTVLDEEARLMGYDPQRQESPFDTERFLERGRRLAALVYPGVFEKMMTRLNRITPDLAQWMVVEGYGKTLSRPELDIVSRELCIVAVLAVLEREKQLISHVRGALSVGATPDMLNRCADDVTEWAGNQCGSKLRSVIEKYT
ncbi:MAG: RdgB/HAM1 family non-canonical purine NTP pyrophosphatase [Ignavibacteria bacterium]|nr:RdgB/HAM1 family non-canonical purine NTP pyrophosphatase [Ignavibacteria bacterium]